MNIVQGIMKSQQLLGDGPTYLLKSRVLSDKLRRESMKPTILGTGLSGLVGSRFTTLYQSNFNFENLDLTTGVDITNKDQVEAFVAHSKAETIIHLAAFTNVSLAYEQKGDTKGLCYQLNVEGTKHIVQAASLHKKYLIHISTDFVFDGTKNGEYTEKDVPSPIEWYGETKLMAETLVRELNNAVILRITYPYQAMPSRPDFMALLMNKMRDNTLPPPFIDHVITPTFVDDIAKVFAFCIDKRPTGLYHATGSSYLSDFEIAQKVNEEFLLEAEITPGYLAKYLQSTHRPYQMQLKTSNAKLQKEFGLTMSTFDDGLRMVHKQIETEMSV